MGIAKFGGAIEVVARDVILPLRHQVLRPDLPIESAMYPEDANPAIFHLAARDAGGAIIGCVTFFPEEFGVPESRALAESTAWRSEPTAWRFRGMATKAECRDRGVGGDLLEAGIAEAGRRGGTRVWCNGRSAARRFYLRHGFVTVGDEFTLPPGNHPHYVFLRDLRPVA